VLRSGKTRALLLRQGGDSISLIGLIDNKEEWRQSGMEGSLNPVLFFRNDRLYAIDDTRFREFEEDGTKRDALQLPRVRSGETVWAADDALAVPHTQGIDLITFSNNVYRVKAGMAVDGQLIGGLTKNGKLIHAAFDDGTLRAFSYVNNALVEEWHFTCPAGRSPATMPSVTDNVLCFADQHGTVYCLNANSGKKLRQVDLGAPLIQAPVIVSDKLLGIDKNGRLTAYKAPQP
jgi:outer membrane protein assembly factor BamB